MKVKAYFLGTKHETDTLFELFLVLEKDVASPNSFYLLYFHGICKVGIGERAAKRATLPLQITPAGCTLKTNASPMSRFIFWPADEFGLCCVAKSKPLDVI